MKFIRMTLIAITSIVLLLVVFVYIFFKVAPQIGGKAEGTRLETMQSAPNFKQGNFQNPVETIMNTPGMSTMYKYFFSDVQRDPETMLETIPFDKSFFSDESHPDSVQMSWFGHSSVLIRINGKNLLIDPVFSERASMFSFLGPERYNYTQHVTVDDMPSIDAVLISHDHYDHLDYETFLQLKARVKDFYVPLGVGAHLEAWGVAPAKIHELNWWNETSLSDSLQLAFVPTRHFSGRALNDRFNTLWGAWVIKGSKKRLFFGGDSGYFEGFQQIGEKYGPFDLALLECGQYNEQWANIHMMPEETSQAGADLSAKAVMPMHWGKFTLSLHSWTEPVERFIEASKDKRYSIVTPKVGEVVYINDLPHHVWWQ